MALDQFGNSTSYLNGLNFDPRRDVPQGGDRDNGYDNHRELPDDSMERIRDLILGDLRRGWDARLQTLETRLQMLEDKVDALRHETADARREHLSALAEGINELGQHVRRLGRP